jgi:hypothetical protein
VHPFPQSSAEVPDDLDARLVVLGTATPHAKDDPASPALATARQMLDSRGNAPRLYRNTLVFLAADRTRLQDLEEAVRRYLAWESILTDKEALNLDPRQVRQAEQQRETADKTVEARLPETYQWLLVPTQVDSTSGKPDPKADVTWQAIRVQGNDSLAVRASKKLRNEELLLTTFAGTRLRMELDRVPLWRGDHVEIRQLVEDFARYLYLPRVENPAVLVRGVGDGLSLITWEQETFAYADSFDEVAGRYRGLRVVQNLHLPDSNPPGLLVKPEVARRQLDAEQLPSKREKEEDTSKGREAKEGDPSMRPAPGPPRRFHGSVALDPLRAGADAGRITQEVIAHLAGLSGAEVHLTLEIEAKVPQGVPDNVERIVTENCRTLKFTTHGFERE